MTPTTTPAQNGTPTMKLSTVIPQSVAVNRTYHHACDADPSVLQARGPQQLDID